MMGRFIYASNRKSLNYIWNCYADCRRMFSIYKDNEEYKNIHEGDNTYSNKKSFSDKLFDDLSQELVDRDLEFYKKIQKPEVNNFLKRIFYERYEEQLS